MALILVKNKDVASLPLLYRLILRFIYERPTIKLEEIHLMMHSIVWWSKKVDITEEELYIIQNLAKMLKNEEEGKYARRKELFAQHKIDYRKFHRLPEVPREQRVFDDPKIN